MILSAAFELDVPAVPVTAPITKLGGKPCWLEAAQWPISRKLGVPMAFIGQIALADVPSLPEPLRISGCMAYVFMTEEVEAVPTWEPEAGENAVVIQPNGGTLSVSTKSLAEYPNRAFPECILRLAPQEEPEMVEPDSGCPGFADYGDEALRKLLDVNKLGGVPCFIQHVEYPEEGGPWKFIMQLHDYTGFPGGQFTPNFGSGQAHVFVSEDGRQGRMLWQC